MTTQFAKASYQEIIDLHTESDKVSVIGIHTPTSDTPRKMFGGFFDQFKKFKYLGCSISLVPAARLPADPLQVSYEAGEATIDPRDMLNPLMFHGCHGNDMGAILNRLYALNSIDAKKMDSIFQYEADTDDTIDVNGFQLEDLYYKALTDNTWKKAHPQRGFKKSGLRPLVYSMATNHQLLGASALRLNNGNVIMQSTQGLPLEVDYESGVGSVDLYSNTSQNDIRFFTPRLTGLGWLDTRNAITSNVVMEDVAVDATLDDVHAALAQINADQQSDPDLPLVYMGMILLPPAYKTEQYFRMIVNHHFAFKDFRGISFSNTLIDTPAYGNFNDDDWTQGGDEVDPDDPGSGGGSGGGDDPGDDPDTPLGAALVVTNRYQLADRNGNPVNPAVILDSYNLVSVDDTSFTFNAMHQDSYQGDWPALVFGVVPTTVGDDTTLELHCYSILKDGVEVNLDRVWMTVGGQTGWYVSGTLISTSLNNFGTVLASGTDADLLTYLGMTFQGATVSNGSLVGIRTVV